MSIYVYQIETRIINTEMLNTLHFFFHLSHPFFKKSCDKYLLKTQCFTQCRDKQQYQCRWWKQDLESHQSWSNWWDLTFKRMNINKNFHNFLPIQPIYVLQHDFYFWIQGVLLTTEWWHWPHDLVVDMVGVRLSRT